VFVLHDDAPKLVLGGELLRWSPAGYASRERRPSGQGLLVTPPSLVAILRAGWKSALPMLHPTALG
jgi:hypothetical protein